MTKLLRAVAMLIALTAILATACGEDGDGDAGHEEGGEGESVISDGDEESGIEYGRDDTYDETRRGARLRLRYDADADAFVGTVENTTEETLDNVRVEVHLSNGVELGPTTPGPLDPGATTDIRLPAEGEDFERWSAHPEVGNDEHGEGGEGEHDGEGEGEHGGEGGEGEGEHDGEGGDGG